VAENFDRLVEEQLDSIEVASCGYLSPVTDPFQPLNQKFRLSEKIIAKFVERNIPIEFITKARVPSEVLEMLEGNPHNFGQVSILSNNQKLNSLLAPAGATLEELLASVNRMARRKIFAVVRIDPIFPYLTDNRKMLRELIQMSVDAGANHLIASVLDIPLCTKEEILFFIRKNFGGEIFRKYLFLYQDRIDNYLQAELSYRLSLFDYLRQEADKAGITFALCMEYRRDEFGNLEGLNKYFMSSGNCEGIDIPIYKRKGKKFYPAFDCSGNCLNCQQALCGIEDLAMGKPGAKKDWKLEDYRRWSTMLEG
jgi:DNA repair photolyase